MDSGANKTPVEIINFEEHLEELILDTFVLVLMVSGINNNGKNLMF